MYKPTATFVPSMTNKSMGLNRRRKETLGAMIVSSLFRFVEVELYFEINVFKIKIINIFQMRAFLNQNTQISRIPCISVHYQSF